MTPDTFHYALENTRVILPPRSRLSTFGSSLLNYYIITEDMDHLNRSHVREGQVEAERPQIISPMYFAKLLIDGFGDRAQAYAEHLSANAAHMAMLKYGFRFRKNETRSYEVHEPIENVIERVKSEVEAKDDPLATILTGVDDAWEVSLLKFMFDLIQSSAPEQVNDLRRRGLLGGDIS
jgi:hypothetical protein